MPTFTPVVNNYERKKDKKHKVSILIYVSEGDKCYLDTGLYVVKGQFTKDYRLKDKYVLSAVLDKIKECEEIILKDLGAKISSYTSKRIKSYLESKQNTATYIDFIAFARQYIKELLEEGEQAKQTPNDRNKKEKRAKHLQTTINAFEDKFGKTFDITLLFSDTLEQFEKHLRSERTIIRLNQFGNEIKTKRKPLTNTGIHDYLVDIQTLFNAACKKYNKKSQGIILIPNDPFEEYKIPQASNNSSQKEYIEIEKIKRIYAYQGKGRAKLGRDCFLLSFFLIGINSVDLYETKYDTLKDGRLSYNRSKTEGRRSDNAFISVKIEPEALEIINQYRDLFNERAFSFYRLYTDSDSFNAAINKGIKTMRDDINNIIEQEIEQTPDPQKKKSLEKEKLEDSVTYYSARDAWATIVRNSLGYSKFIVGECLNHSPGNLKVTDRYIKKEFTWMDEINRRVIDLVFEKNE